MIPIPKIYDKEKAKVYEKNRKKKCQIHFNISPELEIILNKKIKKCGMNQTQFFEKLILEKEIKVIGSPEQLNQIISEIRKIGTNLNQIAKDLNSSFYSNVPIDVKEKVQVGIEDNGKMIDILIQLLDEVKK